MIEMKDAPVERIFEVIMSSGQCEHPPELVQQVLKSFLFGYDVWSDGVYYGVAYTKDVGDYYTVDGYDLIGNVFVTAPVVRRLIKRLQDDYPRKLIVGIYPEHRYRDGISAVVRRLKLKFCCIYESLGISYKVFMVPGSLVTGGDQPRSDDGN